MRRGRLGWHTLSFSYFDSGKYRFAEKLYQEILTKTPNNLYSLSNLGVLYFRTGTLKVRS